MASELYVRKKGVSPMDRLDVVRKLQSTAGSSSTQRPANFLSMSKIHGLSPWRMRLLALSTCPFVRGCPTDAQSIQILFPSANSWK